jgi:HEAT repeat protein
MEIHRNLWQSTWFPALILGVGLSVALTAHVAAASLRQQRSASGSLTPVQLEIERQRTRLGSAEGEERRDAVTRLGSMHHPEASRAALAGLRDPLAIVRATSTGAILSLPAEESASSLIALLSDKDEFVRKETAYALGKTRSRTAVTLLIERLVNDKKEEVRGAAAVALGQISNEVAVAALAAVLGSQSPSKKNKKTKREENPFVLRASARALGQIASRAGVPALIATLQDEKADDDLRRESAFALGAIGDGVALPALRNALSSHDPHLVQIAHESIRKIERSGMQ